MSEVRVAMLQILPTGTLQENLEKGLEYCEQAKKMGAEILLVPNACPMEINRISQLRARAFENMLGIATVNYPKGQPDCNGHSTAFDGIACKPEEGFRDTLIVEADEREGIVIADFPLSEMRAYRQKEVHGNAYRRPELYKPLLSPTIQMPFFRRDNRKNLRMNLIFKI